MHAGGLEGVCLPPYRRSVQWCSRYRGEYAGRAMAANVKRKHWVPALVASITILGGALRLVALGSIPPGLHFDEAVYGLMARDILGGARPIFFTTYTGREPLYMYLMAAVFRFVGVSAWGIRLTSALIGTATIPLVYLLWRQIYSQRVGVFAAALTALSYWHLTVSRNGYPNILIPPIECLALFFLWKGYRAAQWRWMALGGAFIGLILYTYLAARFFPLTVAVFFLYVLAVDRPRRGRRLVGLGIAALVAVAVFAPLGLFFLRHPEHFVERASQVLIFRDVHAGEEWRLLASNFLKTLGGLFLKGDPNRHFNLPGRPIFSPLLAPFFLLGAALALRNGRKAEFALPIIWFVGMITPAILTDNPMPQGQRMFGIIPAIYGLGALGLDGALRWVQPRLRGKFSRLPWGVLALLLVADGAWVCRDYFVRWGRDPQTFFVFHGDYALLAHRAREEMRAGRTVVIQSAHYKHPTVLFLEPEAGEALWAVGPKTLVIPHRPQGGPIYLWPFHDNPLQGMLGEMQERLFEEVETLPGLGDEPAVRVMRLREGVLEAEAQAPALAAFGDEVEILGWEAPERARRDKPLRLLVHWRVARAVEGWRVFSVHLVDEQGVRWAQDSDLGFLTAEWRAGDAVYQVFEVPIPPGMPAGPYEVRLLYSREGPTPLIASRDGKPSGIYISLGTVTFKPDGRSIEPLAPKGQAIGEALQVLSYRAQVFAGVPGGEVQVPVTWQARFAPPKDYTVLLTLRDEAGATRLEERLPLAYAYPTSSWEAGEVVRVVYVLPLKGLDVGRYTLSLQVEGEESVLALGEVRVEGEPRLYTPPPIQHPLSAALGGEIAFLGYDLAEGPYMPGGSLELTLYWQALSAPQGDYKVFVHLIGPDERIWAQHDSAPANWARPTKGWDTGEVVRDGHTLALPQDIPPGEYLVCVGMYEANTLQRLTVSAAPDALLEGNRLLLGRISVGP